MSYPCVNTSQFQVVDGDLTPQPYMQWKHVATNTAAAIQNSYVVNGGNQAADLFQLQVAWTNPYPIAMKVYGLLTRGGTIITSMPRNNVFIDTYYAVAQGVSPADPTPTTQIGRFGIGADMGAYTDTTPNTLPFSNIQTRQGERTRLIGDTITLNAGETYKVRIKLRFDGNTWETLNIKTGLSETELSINTGATRLDLYAYPSL